MAQKFGNSRWVNEGFLDNRVAGSVVGRISFAGVGSVDLYLKGDCRGELAGKAIRFRNRAFVDEDVAAQVLADFENPQIGEVSLISLDPHPHLTPHPYIEWFSSRENHYRIELSVGDVWTLSDEEAAALDQASEAIRTAWSTSSESLQPRRDSPDSEWF